MFAAITDLDTARVDLLDLTAFTARPGRRIRRTRCHPPVGAYP
jgi:hypothetical protein